MAGVTPDAAVNPAASLLSIGLYDDSVGGELGARLFTDEPESTAYNRRLSEAAVRDAFVLATCERIEVFAIELDGDVAPTLLDALAAETGIPVPSLRDQARIRRGEDALAHLFAVAAALESQVVGEPQILGQVRESHRQAADLGLVGPGLDACVQAAYAAAKRVRTETDVGRYPVSIASAALLVARDVHGDLTHCTALLVGLGEMGEFMGGELKAAGVRELAVIHPALRRAQSAAQRLGAHYRPWEELDDALAASDIVVGALGAGRFSVTARQAERALRARRRAPIYFIDAAVPLDIEPQVNALDAAFVYDLEDLERLALKGRDSRQQALQAARKILGEELERFARRHAERGAVPAVVALRQHFEAARADVLAGGARDAQEATRRLINRLLHDPTLALREAAEDAGRGDGALYAALKTLFRLNEERHPAPPEFDVPEGDDK